MPHDDAEIRVEQPDEEQNRRHKKPYVTPRVEVVRALKAVVLGGSPGATDSGAGMGTEFPPGGP
jgi:hypothetical protein